MQHRIHLHREHRVRSSLCSVLIGLLGVGLLTQAGCGPDAGNPWIEQNNAVQEPDVAQVICFFAYNRMWLSFDAAGDQNPEGFKFTMYLRSHDSGKGIIADGMVHVDMYVYEKSPEGKATRTLEQAWTVPTSDLARTEKPGRLGFAYVPYMYWGNAQPYGKEVEIVVRYESPTGRVVQAQSHRTRVPPRKP